VLVLEQVAIQSKKNYYFSDLIGACRHICLSPVKIADSPFLIRLLAFGKIS